MKLDTTSRRATLLALGALLIGCAAADPDEPGSASTPSSEITPEETTPKEHFRGHGFDHVFREALEQVSLTPAQRTKIDALADKLRSEHMSAKSARHDFRAALAGAVADGKLDDPEIADARSALIQSAAGKARSFEKAIGELHATLSAEQRAQLVAALEQRMGRAGKHGDKQGKHGDKQDWRAHKSEKLARALELDDAQLAKWQKATESLQGPAKEDRRARMQSAMKAFVAADFDASSLGLQKDMEDKAAARVDHRVAELRALLPLLDATQLSRLVDVMQHEKH